MTKSRMRGVGPVVRMVEMINDYKTFVGKREGKEPLGRPRRRWEDNVNTGFSEIGLEGVDSIGLDQ
jgi:hypothetical protein